MDQEERKRRYEARMKRLAEEGITPEEDMEMAIRVFGKFLKAFESVPKGGTVTIQFATPEDPVEAARAEERWRRVEKRYQERLERRKAENHMTE